MIGYRIFLRDGSSIYVYNATGYYISESRFVNFQAGPVTCAVVNFDAVAAIVEFGWQAHIEPPFQNPLESSE